MNLKIKYGTFELEFSQDATLEDYTEKNLQKLFKNIEVLIQSIDTKTPIYTELNGSVSGLPNYSGTTHTSYPFPTHTANGVTFTPCTQTDDLSSYK